MKFELIIKNDGTWKHMYQCKGQAHYIDECMCDARQKRGKFKNCKTCTVRKGGKNDPRSKV